MKLGKGSLLALVSLLIMSIVLSCGCARDDEKLRIAEYTVTDSTGMKTHFTTKPRRIATYAFALDSIVLGLVPSKKLVAINHLADDPNSSNIIAIADTIERKTNNPSAEELFSLRPEVVFLFDNVKAEVAVTLRALGVNVIVCKRPTSIAEVKTTIELVAKALGETDKGQQLIAQMDKELAKTAQSLQAIKSEQKQKVAVISMVASYGGKGSAFDDICTHANVINAIAESGMTSGQALTKEMLVKINPDFLILPSFNNHGTVNINKFNREYTEDPALQTLKAIQNKRFYYPREGYIYNVSQDIVFGVQEVAHAAYGDIIPLPEQKHLSVAERGGL